MAEVGTGLSTNINESLGPLFLLDEAMSRPEAYQAKVDPPVLLTTAGNGQKADSLRHPRTVFAWKAAKTAALWGLVR